MMTQNKYKRTSMAIFWVMCAFLFAPLPVSGTTLVYPGDPNWKFDSRNSAGTAAISANNPRGYYLDNGTWVPGNASLALTTSGSPDDWAFYSIYAGGGSVWNETSTFGLLSAIDQLSFDWYRTLLPITWSDYQEDYLGGPWRAQTPVLRLLIEDDGIISELIWEKWYTNTDTAQTGTWVTEDITNQNFWLHVISTDAYNLTGNTLSYWDSYLSTAYLSNAEVIGISVGVGSAWYDAYSGYVDNIFLSFNVNGSSVPAIDANFELPIPEPSACWLVASGLSFWAAALWWRKKKQSGETQK